MFKNFTCILCLLFINNLVGQSVTSKKPEYLLIVNNEIVTKEKVNELGKKGFIKSMNKGVTDKFRDSLIIKLGKKIAEKEFIIQFDLYTEEELKKLPKVNKSKSKAKQNMDDGYIVKVNQLAPDFTLQTLKGDVVMLSKLKGKVILLNFWATWCAPCLREFYDIQPQILEPLNNKPFVFIPIAIGEKQETVLYKMNQLKKDGIHFNPGVDLHKNIWNKYATNTIPKSVIIDQKGNIVMLVSGGSEENILLLKNKIIELLNN